jgi:hypothetical protein
MSVNQCGYQDALFDLNTKKLVDNNVSHQAINKKVLSGKFSEHFFSLNDQIIQKFFKKERSGRTFGVDGSQVNLSSSLRNNGFRPVKSLKYCQGLLTVIFDIDFQIPYAYQLTSSTNERTAFYDLLIKIEKNSIRDKDLLIFDRGSDLKWFKRFKLLTKILSSGFPRI